MANFYRGHFPGRSYLLELPTEKDEKQLVEKMKEFILELGRADKNEIKKISSVEKIMSHLTEGLKGHQMFLAVDNVWDWTVERAYQIVSMACKVAGSKILVSSRSKALLERLRPWRIVPVPSITEDEAVEVLKSLSFFLPDVILPQLEDLKRVARFCSFDGQCHPLLLKVMGGMLRHRGGHMNHEQGWKDLISRLQTGPSSDEENTILEVIERSFLALSPKLQNTFIDLVTCTPSRSYEFKFNYNDFKWRCKWLSMIHDGFTKMDMRDQLIELEYHGVLEIKDEREISIHDLHKRVARRRAAGRDACLFEGESLSDLSIIGRNTRYIVCSDSNTGASSLMRVTRHCSKLEIFSLKSWSSFVPEKRILSVASCMQCLRFLEMSDCTSLEEIKGWEGTPNLVSLKMGNCSSLQKLGDMGCLQKLEHLYISESRCVPDLTQCSELKKLEFRHSDGLKRLASLGQPPKLKKLNVSNNSSLEDLRAVCTFTALQKLKINETSPGRIDLTNLARLKVFKAAPGCNNLKMVKLPVTCSLQVLYLRGCELLLSELPSGSLSRGLELVLCDGGVTATNHGRPIHGFGAFINLRVLTISGLRSGNAFFLDVSGLTSLITFQLDAFPALQVIQGLDALPKLKKLSIWNCKALGDSTPLFPTSLEELLLSDCVSLTDVSSLTTPLPLLRVLNLSYCISLRELPNLTHLTSLKKLDLGLCSSLRELPNLTRLTSLKEVYLDKSIDRTSTVRELFCKEAHIRLI